DTDLQSTTSVRTSVHCKSEGRSFCRLRRQTALRCKIEEVRPETKSEVEKLSTETGQVHSQPITSIELVGSAAAIASFLRTSKRSSSPAFPLVEPDATTTNRPPANNVARGIGFTTSPDSFCGWPETPAFHCQQVWVDPNHESLALGLGDHPSQPSSGALTSALMRIWLTSTCASYACARRRSLIRLFRSASPSL